MSAGSDAVVLTSPYKIAVACRLLVIEQIKACAAAMGHAVPAVNGQLNGWLTADQMKQRFPCDHCNEYPAEQERIVVTLKEGQEATATHERCCSLPRGQATDDATPIALALQEAVPWLFPSPAFIAGLANRGAHVPSPEVRPRPKKRRKNKKRKQLPRRRNRTKGVNRHS